MIVLEGLDSEEMKKREERNEKERGYIYHPRVNQSCRKRIPQRFLGLFFSLKRF